MKQYINQFGGKITADLIERYAKSPNWKNGKFENLIETKMDINIQTLPKMLYKQFIQTEGRIPPRPLPIIRFDRNEFTMPSDKARLKWFGHSVVLMRINGKNILIDPMLGSDASPIAPFPTKRFSEDTLAIIDELPEIDLMILSHDHYDHIDYRSLMKLKAKTKKYFVALGVKRHLVHWGIAESSVTEFDWWEDQDFNNTRITFTPSRHFAGRGLTDRSKSLWGGWVFNTNNEKIWFSGDGGYGPHFKYIGERMGPFDFGFMECGQYNDNWHAIHMFPEESVQAAIDARVNIAMPVHWGGFALSHHRWQDPAERFLKASIEAKSKVSTPRLGQTFDTSVEISDRWWEEFK